MPLVIWVQDAAIGYATMFIENMSLANESEHAILCQQTLQRGHVRVQEMYCLD